MACTIPISAQQQLERSQRLELLLTKGVYWLRSAEATALAQAQTVFSAAYDLAPHDPRVLDGLGCVAWRQGKTSRAQRYFRAALIKDSRYDRAYAHLALLAQDRGHLKEAQSWYEQALVINPLNYRARNNFALVLAELRLEKRALHELSKAQLLAEQFQPLIQHNRTAVRGRILD